MKRGVFIKMDKIKSFNYKLDDFFQRNKLISSIIIFIPFTLILMKNIGILSENNNLSIYIVLSIIAYIVSAHSNIKIYKWISILNLILSFSIYTLIIFSLLFFINILELFSYISPYICMILILYLSKIK